MAVATLSVVTSTIKQTNDQRIQEFYGQLKVSAPTDTYPPGGLTLDSVLQAALQPNSNQAPLRVVMRSATGSGYIYQRITATGKMMILQTPPNGSLTTAAPLQELPSSGTLFGGGAQPMLSGVWADTIEFEAKYLRNS